MSMTTSRTLSRQSAPATAPHGLPEPGERRRLRELWGLTPQQVAVAFGVRAATVRSWEAGRSAPTGKRREAYRRFLQGLAQRADLQPREASVPASRRSESPVRPHPHHQEEARLQVCPAPKQEVAATAAPTLTGVAVRSGHRAQQKQPSSAGWHGVATAVTILAAWLLVLVLLGVYLPGWNH